MTTMGHSKQRQGFGGCTPARDAVVKFISDHLKEHGAAPTAKQVQHHMGWKQVASALDCIRKCDGRLAAEVIRAVLDTQIVRPKKPAGMRRSDWLAQRGQA